MKTLKNKAQAKEKSFVSIGLTKSELVKVQEVKDFFDLNSNAGAVRKSIAFMATVIKNAGPEGMVQIIDEDGTIKQIILA